LLIYEINMLLLMIPNNYQITKYKRWKKPRIKGKAFQISRAMI
jgi:hypothetical protein